jgi:hypothetical protein
MKRFFLFAAAVCAVAVSCSKDVEVTSVTLDQTEVSVKVGETCALVATVAPADATDPAVTWTSSDVKVATVAEGVVTGVAAGEATITATAGGKTATCTVTVYKDPIDDIVLKAGSVSYSVNIDAPYGYLTAVEDVSEVASYVEMGMMDSAAQVMAQALYNTKDVKKDATVTKTATDPFFYGLAGGKDITADGTYYITVVAVKEDGDFDNENVVMVTYPAK